MDNTRKKQMGIIIAAIAVIVIAVVGTIYIYNQKQAEVKQLTLKNTDLNELIDSRDSVVNEMVTAFNDIEKNLKFVKEKRKQLSIEEKEGNIDKKQAIIDDINLMNKMLEESSQHIAELEKKLKNSGIKMNAFQERIASLSQTITDQNSEIETLRNEVEKKDVMVADLNDKVETMQVEIAKQADTLANKLNVIDEQTNKLNEGHVAYGTFKELKEKGLLEREGGFLGILGQNKALQENFDDEYFTELDIRDTKMIPLHAKKATVITEHPADSYKLVEEDGLVSYLEIENPEEFWKISKYAVIEVK